MIIINNNNKCLEWTALSRLCFFNQDCWHSQCFHIVALKEVLAVKLIMEMANNGGSHVDPLSSGIPNVSLSSR